MASTSKIFLLTALLVLIMPHMGNSFRPLNNPIGSKTNLEGSSTCWESLMHLQACSGEVVLFFLNGETSLGHSCCEAIQMIERHCWPALLGSIGLSTEETNILKGYCDESDQTKIPPSPLSIDEPSEEVVPEYEKLIP